jgi:hypothetical protein
MWLLSTPHKSSSNAYVFESDTKREKVMGISYMKDIYIYMFIYLFCYLRPCVPMFSVILWREFCQASLLDIGFA